METISRRHYLPRLESGRGQKGEWRVQLQTPRGNVDSPAPEVQWASQRRVAGRCSRSPQRNSNSQSQMRDHQPGNNSKTKKNMNFTDNKQKLTLSLNTVNYTWKPPVVIRIRVSLLIHEIFVYRVSCIVYFNTRKYIHDNLSDNTRQYTIKTRIHDSTRH